MISEFRRLVFSSSELEKAIKAFNKVKASKLPDGEIVAIKVVTEPNIGVRVRVRDFYCATDEQEVEVDAGYLGAAMLFHCKQSRIPIPKSPKKTLERAGDGLALSFSINAAPELVDIPPSEVAAMMNKRTRGTDIKRGNGEAILVLEDDPEVRSFAVGALEKLGYQIHEAADAKAAMGVLEQEMDNLDLLLSDVVLPGGVSGPEFAVKAKGLHPKLKLVFMSGYVAGSDPQGNQPDFDETMLTKPFRIADLASVIHDTLAT